MGHVIRYFSKQDDSYVGECPLEVSLVELQKLFGEPADNPMYECYLVSDEHVSLLRKYASIHFNLDDFEYFVEYDAL